MSTLKSDLQANLLNVRDAIQYSAGRSGRNPDDICLVVVTKKQPVVKIQELVNLGILNIGENYPEEAATKIKEMGQPSGLCWHMIGHLQSRKTPIVADLFSAIHSIDRMDTAKKLSQLLVEREAAPMNGFVEVNISGEESKYGIPAWDKNQWDAIIRFIVDLSVLPKLVVKGLMVMPPFFTDPEQSRPYFEKARTLLVYISRNSGVTLNGLSMGTSLDFQVAIEEGASVVRIGTAIMGPRSS